MKIKQMFRNMVPDKLFLQYRFRKVMGKRLNLKTPQTYNEKLQWLKLYDRNIKYSILVDKYEVRRVVSKLLGEKYLVNLYGVWNSFDEINFYDLPEQFVLKTTHDSGGVFICKDKNQVDIENLEKSFDKKLRENFYYVSREWPYKNVQPRIIAEQYIGDKDKLPRDYKFFVFDGKVDCVMVCKGRELGYPDFYFYDINWKRLNYNKVEPKGEIEKPPSFEEMLYVARKLGKGYKHVRIDLYNINGKIYFGEYTLYNQGGFDTDISFETDLLWGSKIELH